MESSSLSAASAFEETFLAPAQIILPEVESSSFFSSAKRLLPAAAEPAGAMGEATVLPMNDEVRVRLAVGSSVPVPAIPPAATFVGEIPVTTTFLPADGDDEGESCPAKSRDELAMSISTVLV